MLGNEPMTNPVIYGRLEYRDPGRLDQRPGPAGQETRAGRTRDPGRLDQNAVLAGPKRPGPAGPEIRAGRTRDPGRKDHRDNGLRAARAAAAPEHGTQSGALGVGTPGRPSVLLEDLKLSHQIRESSFNVGILLILYN